MKLNWGFGIALFYATFMMVLLFFVFKSTTYDNSLVADNYYEKDLQYQSHYDKIVNSNSLPQQVAIAYNAEADQVELQFPQNMKDVKGTFHFFDPRTKHRDIIKPIKLDENGQMNISTKNLVPGRWKFKLDWEDASKAYFKETEFVL